MTVLITSEDAAAQAARSVPNNPHELCRDFQKQPPPAAYWCASCHWNRDMHGSEIHHAAIATELQRLTAGEPR